MLKESLAYKLKAMAESCKIHRQRMLYALDTLRDIFPIDQDSLRRLAPEQISHTDQLIYRFSQLQDTMGTRLFPLILQGLGETSQGQSLIDMLNRMEKLGLIDSAERWLKLREIRNLVSQEYPDNEKELSEGLNELRNESLYLASVLDDLLRAIGERDWLASPA